MPDDFDFSRKPQREDAGSQTPFITYGLAALCVLITLAFMTAGNTPGSLWYQVGSFGVQSADSIWEGKYYALLTCFFLHLSIWHILFNIMWLTRLGRIMELTMNPLHYILFMVGGTLVGSCAQLAFTGQTGAGASGAVYAMFGLLWAGRGYNTAWRSVATRENLNLFIIWGVLCIVLTWMNWMRVANAAHFGGFLFGLCIGWLFYSPRRQPLWAIPLALLGVMCVLSVTWLPWSHTWTFWKGNIEFKKQHYVEAISWYQRSLRLGGDPRLCWHNIGAAWNNRAFLEEQQGHNAEAETFMSKAKEAYEKAGPEEPEPGSESPGNESSPAPAIGEKRVDESGKK